MLLLEHPPTYTIGTGGDAAHVLASPEELARLGAEVLRVDRGGDVTYHGPGQLVGYPIVHLGERPDVVAYVRRLEQVLIRALADLGVESWAEPGYTGVWTAQGKVAAIGVRTARVGHHARLRGERVRGPRLVPPHRALRPGRSGRGLGERRGGAAGVDRGDGGRRRPPLRRRLRVREVEAQTAAFTRGAGRDAGSFEVDRLVAAGAFTPEGRRRSRPSPWAGACPGSRSGRSGCGSGPTWGPATGTCRAWWTVWRLHTVCQEAGCPNIYECWAAGTATFLLMGEVCTRACSFCDVTTGRPGPLDPGEPERVAEAVARLGLRHAVLTSVDRDDLPDGGAGAFAATIRAPPGAGARVRRRGADPRLQGGSRRPGHGLAARPEVLNHNLETVVRLQREVRTAASYGRSLALLARAKQAGPEPAWSSPV